MVYAFATLSEIPLVLFIDCPRSKSDTLQYDFLEEVKDGFLMVTKYESRPLDFKPPHVVVFMNDEPDSTKLSDDRWDIVLVTNE